MHRQPLDAATWTLRAVGQSPSVPSHIRGRDFAAWVPSCVHSVLMKHGAIEDPYLGEGEKLTAWIGETDWEYRCVFNAAGELFDHERIDLACDGLDTVATIRLNDREIGGGENMHVAYRFDARSALRRGSNELVITFASPLHYAREHERRLGKLPYMSASLDRLPYNFIRKMACNFGWDWGPQVVTSGVWKGARLEGWTGLRIAHVRPRWEDEVTLWVDVSVERARAGNDRLFANGVLEQGGKTLDYSAEFSQRSPNTLELCLSAVDAPLWWPSGHGLSSLHDLKIWTDDESKTIFDNWHGRVGLRTVELDTSPDDIGRGFTIKVNGKPIFCKGFNWIPDDCFLDRANDPARLRKRIQQAVDCGANMLRVWGGGIYETDAFYDICDELGVMVWQDFPFACAAYPEEEPFKSLVEEEARQNVARLAHHPSLVLWNGNNENIWGYHDWGWKKDGLVKGRTWGPGFYLDLLPKIVAEVDPSRPYWAASPWSGDADFENGLHPNLETHGNKHVWEVWHGPGDFVNYRRFRPRFCSEFGFQGPPTFATLSRVMPPDQRRRDSRQMEIRQKSTGGNERNDRIAAMYFDLPKDFDDYLYILQVMQARALQCGVEWFRSRAPTCMGTLIWQLNDCWPVHSWSAIDGDGRPKPMWYAARRFFADRLVTIQPIEALSRAVDENVAAEYGALGVHLHNDHDEVWTGELSLRSVRLGGETIARSTSEFRIEPRVNKLAATVDPTILRLRDPTREFILAETSDGRRSFWFFGPDKGLEYPTPRFEAELSRDGEIHRLAIRAESMLRDVCVFADRLHPDATVSDQLITLLPGETTTVEIRSPRELSVDELISPPVFNCVNRFGAVDRA